MKNKKSNEARMETKLKIKRIRKLIVKYAVIFMLTMAILMVLPKWEKYIIYCASAIAGLSVLLVVKEKYISVKRLGLGKTRKSLEKEINKLYFKNILISFLCVGALVLIDFLAYHLTVNIWLVIYLYLLGLVIFTMPINFLLNIRQKLIIKIIIICFGALIVGGSFYIFFKTDYFYFSYILLIIYLAILYEFRQKGYHKKDL